MKAVVAILLPCVLAGCGIPADPDGTASRVAASGIVRIGIDARSGVGDALIAEVARQAHARPRLVHAPLEPLLTQLERDELDLVVGRFVRPTPWKTAVALGPPVAATGEGKARVEIRAAMKNGENRWVMLVERASRQVARP